MLDYRYIIDAQTHEHFLETTLTGKPLLTTPQLNKGTAFTEAERHNFGLLGKLPLRIESLEEQVARAYYQFSTYQSLLQKHIYLYNLHDKNQILFYKLVSLHLAEILPVIYTPIVGTAVKEFSKEFRQARGLYLAYPHQHEMEEILDNRSNPEVDLIVVTDGEGVLGIGDQGIGGMDIPIAKLMVYSLCGAVNPLRTLPIQLDVGTDNEQLLSDPLYLGWRHKRIRGKQYDDFIEKFISIVQRKFPHIFLHWEDFGRETARRNFDRYRERICSFNDDMQGTGVVTLAALLAAMKINQTDLTQQRIVIFGAGTAGTGIADQIGAAMQRLGLSKDEACQNFWLIDRNGLLLANDPNLTSAQQAYARNPQETLRYKRNKLNQIDLIETVKRIKPTVLIGTSGVAGAFTKRIVKTMARYTPRPIIFTLSNPIENCEATPSDLVKWTHGNALIATGSPFGSVHYKKKLIPVTQCNNALAFPGIGLGALAVKARQITDNMLWAACLALSESANANQTALLLPMLQDAKQVTRVVAMSVAKAALQDKGAADDILPASLQSIIEDKLWEPRYLPMRKLVRE